MAREIIHMQLNRGRRVIAVSDIHGHSGIFDALLEKAGFSGDDFLVIIGDMIECGSDSLGCLRRAMELVKGGNCVALCGNWEASFSALLDGRSDAELKARSMQLMEEFGACLLAQMCAEAGFRFGPETDMSAVMPRVREKFADEIAFIDTLPVILDTEDYFFVHGGVPTLDREALAAMDQYSMLKCDHFADSDVCFENWVITGHWPVANYDSGAPCSAPHVNIAKRIVSIDGGMGRKRGGQLNALIMRAGAPGEFGWDAADALPVARALEAQAASADPLNIQWDARHVEIIAEKGDIYRVRHLTSGREMDVPAQKVWRAGRDVCAPDCTDNMLEARPGDIISIELETSMGIFGKKDSIHGWYAGKYEKP